MSEILAKDFAEIKSFIDSRNAKLQYVERAKTFELIAFDGIFTMSYALTKEPADPADLNDFTNNYQSMANQPLKNFDFIGGKLSVVTGSTGLGIGGGLPPTTTSKIKYLDMNPTNGGIARETDVSDTFVNILDIIGSGLIYGFLINLERGDEWIVKYNVDGNDVFSTDGIKTSDIVDNNIYDLEFSNNFFPDNIGINMYMESDKLVWNPPCGYPIEYGQNITISIKRDDNKNKQFRGGLLILTRET